MSESAAIPLELLAPAGDMAALRAALDGGANAIYLGLRSLNARRRAKNFTPEELLEAVKLAHERGAKVYLTLNTDLTQRELGQAARMLELTRQSGVDAVLVRDPAFLALRPHYPSVEFHFSTQTCITSSADVLAAGELGATRVVLARELSLDEIAACSAASKSVQTEVFVQGALCFCISGRCLLSSWAGGRSGNRGSCTSPCRVPWTVEDEPADGGVGTPLSMHDLGAVARLADLHRAGAAAIKIEGRLKTANWVFQAVSTYRCALDGGDPVELLECARKLGAYTGRAMTDGYLDGRRTNLTGLSGREAAARTMTQPPGQSAAESEPRYVHIPDESDPATFTLSLDVTDHGILCRCVHAGRATEWKLPRTVVRRAEKAITIQSLLNSLSQTTIDDCRMREHSTNAPDFQLVPRAANAISDELGRIIRRTKKKIDEPLRLDLPEGVRHLLEADKTAHGVAANSLSLGDSANRLRVDARQLSAVASLRPSAGVIIEGCGADTLPGIITRAGSLPITVALPQVFFEADVSAIAELCCLCATARVPVEVNSWGGWYLARKSGARMEGGPGLPVLNTLAARTLAARGLSCVTISPEADRQQIEEITRTCPVPCSLVVFGRPPLMVTRVQLADEQLGKLFADRRDVRIRPRLENGLWTFRPETPYDLRGRRNPKIRAKHLVMDLIASPDPLADWRSRPKPDSFGFNYDRALA